MLELLLQTTILGNVTNVTRVSTAATTEVQLVLRVPLAVTALMEQPVVRIQQQRVLWGPMQVEQQHAKLAVLVNIRQPLEEQIAAIAALVHMRQLPVHQFVPFAVRVNIRRVAVEPMIVIIVMPASTSVIPILQPSTIKKRIVKCAVLVNIRHRREEPMIATNVALLAST